MDGVGITEYGEEISHFGTFPSEFTRTLYNLELNERYNSGRTSIIDSFVSSRTDSSATTGVLVKHLIEYSSWCLASLFFLSIIWFNV